MCRPILLAQERVNMPDFGDRIKRISHKNRVLTEQELAAIQN